MRDICVENVLKLELAALLWPHGSENQTCADGAIGQFLLDDWILVGIAIGKWEHISAGLNPGIAKEF